MLNCKLLSAVKHYGEVYIVGLNAIAIANKDRSSTPGYASCLDYVAKLTSILQA